MLNTESRLLDLVSSDHVGQAISSQELVQGLVREHVTRSSAIIANKSVQLAHAQLFLDLRRELLVVLVAIGIVP